MFPGALVYALQETHLTMSVTLLVLPSACWLVVVPNRVASYHKVLLLFIYSLVHMLQMVQGDKAVVVHLQWTG